jgi:nucleoside-diphosphate-sugar epimerase
MVVVVTGASGFLGSALVRHLRAVGMDVRPVSRRPVTGGVRVDDYTQAPAGDILVHLAETNDRRLANEGGVGYQRQADETLSALLHKGYSHIIYGSSAVLYGDGSAAQHRTEDPVQVVDIYTRIKRQSEQAVLARKGIVARLVNVYGRGMAGGTVLTTILEQIPGHGPLKVMDTSPVRDFIWVEDAASALAAMVQGTATGVYNVGSGTGISIGEMARLALGLAGEADREVVATRPGHRPSSLIVDISRTEAALGWRPTMALEGGLAAMLAGKQERT